MNFKNVYEDTIRAESYARLEFPGTYYLAYRDIPRLIEKYVSGKKALDFGCGTGRSTRYLKNLGFNTTGADISSDMLKIAKISDPKGEYILLPDGCLSYMNNRDLDLITALFTFDNIPGVEYRTMLLNQLGSLLNSNGVIIMVNSTPEIYLNEWLSFSTKEFPENKQAKGGDKVKIIMLDVEDKRPVEDIVWFDNDYRDLFFNSGLNLIESCKPLGKPEEPYRWINEMKIAPWIIYVLKKQN